MVRPLFALSERPGRRLLCRRGALDQPGSVRRELGSGLLRGRRLSTGPRQRRNHADHPVRAHPRRTDHGARRVSRKVTTVTATRHREVGTRRPAGSSGRTSPTRWCSAACSPPARWPPCTTGAASPEGTNFHWEINGTDGDLVITGDTGHLQVGEFTHRRGTGDPMLSTGASPYPAVLRPRAPTGCAAPPPDNVAHAYAQIQRDLTEGGSEVPDFAHAARHHRLLDRIERAAEHA